MSEWKLKRFWKQADIEAQDGGFAVLLDGRPVKTPAKAPLLLPNAQMAEKITQEWDAVDEHINPSVMPYTRSANAAIDKVSVQHAEVAALIAAYAETDLLCYRADSPEALSARQSAAWDPYLDWVSCAHGLKLGVATGIIPVEQPAESLAKAHELTLAMSPFALTAFHDLVSLSGSFILGLAAAEGRADAASLWKTSRIDEIWQEEIWGQDDEATENAALKQAQFEHAFAFFQLASLN